MRPMLLAVLGLAATFASGKDAMALVCPDETAVKDAVRRYIEEDYWNQGQRDIWKVSAIENFQFSPIKFGKVVRMDVDYGGARDVCPARLVFEFTAVKMDGSSEVTKMGEGKVFYLYQDEFGEWTFKMG